MKLLLTFLSLLICTTVLSQQTPQTIPDVLTTIHSRKSVRNYTGAHVSDSLVEVLLRAGMAAPTAMNRQPWYFVVIRDTLLLNKLSESIMFADMLKNASVAIAVCGNMRNVAAILPKYWIQDCAAASQNILLAAEGLGLGAVWIGLYPTKARYKKPRRLLNLPSHIVPLSLISIGYPTGLEKPKDKWDPDKILWMPAK